MVEYKFLISIVIDVQRLFTGELKMKKYGKMKSSIYIDF